MSNGTTSISMATLTAMESQDTTDEAFWEPSINTAFYAPISFTLGVLLTILVYKCCQFRKQDMNVTVRSKRQESFTHDNAVYWDHDAAFQTRMEELREQRRTDEIFSYNSRHEGSQTEIDFTEMNHLLMRSYQVTLPEEPELDTISLPQLPPPPPPIEEDLSYSNKTAPHPPRRRSKDDCIRKEPSYRKSHIPSCLQECSLFRSAEKLATSDQLTDIVFKDQNSPLHRKGEHYTSVASVVLIPNNDQNGGPTGCPSIRHSYINLKTLASTSSSLSASNQVIDYENTRVWVKSIASDHSDDETFVDCKDKGFQEVAHETLLRKQSRSRAMHNGDDQYTAFDSLAPPQLPERPRTGYVVMELTEEVLSFLRVKENKTGKHITISKENLADLYSDGLKNPYMSMSDSRPLL